jgi:DNA-binding GntR family transcriptional regulator
MTATRAPAPSVAQFQATIASRVADDLRRRILSGDLAPGQRLKIDELAVLCGVSHMPVREALRALDGEGVLIMHAHRGAVVRGVDRRFILNFYDVRAAVEGLLTERCAEKIDAGALRALKVAGTAFESAAEEGAAALVTANRRFHEIINNAADNPEAVRMLAHGRVLADALRVRFGYGSGRFEAIVTDHRAIVRAIERRDTARAGEVARRHCVRARDDLLDRMAVS